MMARHEGGVMGKSSFDVPPLKRSERKAYNKFANKMNELGYTAKLAQMMKAMMLGEKYDEKEFNELMAKVRLEEMGIDTSRIDEDGALVDNQ
jgi:CRISPR/Cas system-associated protein endoribonuclease Cas2